VRLGKERSFPSYGWDNEYGDRQMYVPRDTEAPSLHGPIHTARPARPPARPPGYLPDRLPD